MIFEAVAVASLVALISLSGVLFFGTDKRLQGIERYVVPVAVGVFLSLVLYELIPETLASSERWGGLVIFAGFAGFYILSHKLHQRYHHLEAEDCDKKGAASLLLVGDSIHNFTDGIILGGAFLIDPAVGVATAIAIAVHEMPQEVVEFGVLLRAGYTKKRALLLNLISASTIVLGVLAVFAVTEVAEEFAWILSGLAAGNLLFLAASDLLPRIHGNLKNYGSIWRSAGSIVFGFVFTSALVVWSHESLGHGYAHGHAEEHHDELDEDYAHHEDEAAHAEEHEHDEKHDHDETDIDDQVF